MVGLASPMTKRVAVLAVGHKRLRPAARRRSTGRVLGRQTTRRPRMTVKKADT